MNATFYAGVRSSVFGGAMKQEQVDGCEVIFAAWERSGDGDDAKLAYLLATAFHETARTMQPIYERGAKSYFNKYEPRTKIGKALGNTVEGDGYRFRGRGFVQLTGRANYRKAGEKMSVELLGSPDRALEPAVAGMAIVRGALEGWYTAKKLGAYINSETVDYVNARRVINGTDKAELIAGYAFHFEKAIAAARKVGETQYTHSEPVPKAAEPAQKYDRPSEPAKAEGTTLLWLIGITLAVAAIGWGMWAVFFAR